MKISQVLGVKPLRLDSADVVPIHRPRFCWSNVSTSHMDGVRLEEKEFWIDVHMDHPYPQLSQWLEEGAEWPGYQEGAVLPTAMKSIKRMRPPPKPAGLERARRDCVLRWEADDFRFPPYQYADKFRKRNRWRLISAEERELLHGLGFGHTTLCWNAGKIKQDGLGFLKTCARA